MPTIPFKITDTIGLDAHLKIWNADGEYYHWSTQNFKAWDLDDQPYMMMNELPVAGVGRAQYVATIEGNDINSSLETLYYSWAIYDNGTPNENDNPISYIYEIPITAGREGSWSTPGDAMGLDPNVFSSLVESGITVKSPTLADGAIRLFEGNDYLAVIGEAITRTLTQADNNFIAVSCLLVIKKGDVVKLSKTGTVLVPTGLIKVTFDINSAETFAIGRDFFEHYISITNAVGLTKTPWFGKTQILASGISNAA